MNSCIKCQAEWNAPNVLDGFVTCPFCQEELLVGGDIVPAENIVSFVVKDGEDVVLEKSSNYFISKNGSLQGFKFSSLNLVIPDNFTSIATSAFKDS